MFATHAQLVLAKISNFRFGLSQSLRHPPVKDCGLWFEIVTGAQTNLLWRNSELKVAGRQNIAFRAIYIQLSDITPYFLSRKYCRLPVELREKVWNHVLIANIDNLGNNNKFKLLVWIYLNLWICPKKDEVTLVSWKVFFMRKFKMYNIFWLWTSHFWLVHTHLLHRSRFAPVFKLFSTRRLACLLTTSFSLHMIARRYDSLSWVSTCFLLC